MVCHKGEMTTIQHLMNLLQPIYHKQTFFINLYVIFLRRCCVMHRQLTSLFQSSIIWHITAPTSYCVASHARIISFVLSWCSNNSVDVSRFLNLRNDCTYTEYQLHDSFLANSWCISAGTFDRRGRNLW